MKLISKLCSQKSSAPKLPHSVLWGLCQRDCCLPALGLSFPIYPLKRVEEVIPGGNALMSSPFSFFPQLTLARSSWLSSGIYDPFPLPLGLWENSAPPYEFPILLRVVFLLLSLLSGWRNSHSVASYLPTVLFSHLFAPLTHYFQASASMWLPYRGLCWPPWVKTDPSSDAFTLH